MLSKQRRECRNVERETPWENRIHSPLNLVGKQTSLTSNRGVTSKCSNFADWRTLLSNNSDPRWTKSSPASVSSEPSDQSRASRTERLRETQQTNDRIMLWLHSACVKPLSRASSRTPTSDDVHSLMRLISPPTHIVRSHFRIGCITYHWTKRQRESSG